MEYYWCESCHNYHKCPTHKEDCVIFACSNFENKEEILVRAVKPLTLAWTDQDYTLFKLIKEGLVEPVQNFLESYKDKDSLAHKTDENGHTIWHLALYQENDHLLQYLLTLDNIPLLYDILLHSVHKGDLSIVDLVYQVITERYPHIGKLCELPRWKHSYYLPEITPMILAAESGNIDLIQYLHEKSGENLIDLKEILRIVNVKIRTVELYPRPPELQISNIKDLSTNLMYVHLFATVTSPEYLCYRASVTDETIDLIKEACESITALKFFGKILHEHERKFKAMRRNVRQFLNDLLDSCVTTDEVKMLLKQRNVVVEHAVDPEFPTLFYIFERRLYGVIAHPHIQKILFYRWAGSSWPAWKHMSYVQKAAHIIARVILFPIICVWVYLDGWSKAAHFYRSPINKCINDFAAYFYFLIFLGIESYFLYTRDYDVHNTPCKPLEILIIVTVLGQGITLIRRFYAAPRYTLATRWNYFEALQFIVFGITFYEWGAVWIQEKENPYPVTILRSHWKGDDPLLIGEACFALAVVISYIRFMRFFQLNFYIGPTQIALASMVTDVAIFFVFFSVIGISFAVGLYFIYSRFSKHIIDLDGRGVLHDFILTNNFASYAKACQTLLWGLLALADADSAVFVDNEEINFTGTSAIVQIISYGLWMIYHLIATMLLMNMLIGYLSNTLNAIETNLEATWIYNRTVMWVYYMRGTSLPPPFNILPSMYTLKLWYQKLRDLGTTNKKSTIPRSNLKTKPADCSGSHCWHKDSLETESESRIRLDEYRLLTKELAMRYLRSKRKPLKKDDEIEKYIVLHERLTKVRNELYILANSGVRKENSRVLLQQQSTVVIPTDENFMPEDLIDFKTAWMSEPRPVFSAFRTSFTPDDSSN